MATILYIETSTTVCSVAISNQGALVYEQIESEGPSHAVKLPLFIESALHFIKENQLVLNAIAVSSGPGSYTGLRIGVSTAKGLCYGMDLPLIAVNTLGIIAYGALQSYSHLDGLLVPMIDARRMEVYTTLYNKDLETETNYEAKIIDQDSYSDLLANQKLYFCGNGSSKCKEIITHANAIFIDDVVPLARFMVEFAESAYQEGRFEDVAYYEPFYLKEFQATQPKHKVM